MEKIIRESKTTIFLQIQYVLAANWSPERVKTVEFERALLDNGLDFHQTQSQPNAFMLIRQQNSPMQVRLETPAPQVVSVLVSANNPHYDYELFARDAEAVMAAFSKVWHQPMYQILNVNTKIHHLYSTQGDAFGYLWEHRLRQSPADFAAFGGRPVAGGGLRLVLPPHSTDGKMPCSIDVRIESYFRQAQKMFIETAFVWPQPLTVSAEQGFNPLQYLQQTELFAVNEVWQFLIRSAG